MPDQDPSLGLIIETNSKCLLKGQPWASIPTLVWPDGIDIYASDWIRKLVVEYDVAPTSAHEYLNILRPFLRFLRKRGRAWHTVNDELLVFWREHLRRAQKLSVRRVNTCLKTIFAFYRWAEESKIIRYQVGIYSEADLPSAIAGTSFPISAKRTFSKGRHGRVYGMWTTPLTLSESDALAQPRHTPTEDEIRRLHEITVETVQGERNSLIWSWMEEAGPRRAEVLRIGKSHMPTGDELANLIERDDPWIVRVRRKGGTSKPLNVPVDLIVRTLDFVQFARREVVDSALDRIVGYKEPDELFLSQTTGLVLHRDSLTSIGRRTFRKAGVMRANEHRLRARLAVRTIETLVDAVFDGTMIGSESSWIETILIKAAEMMGHASPASLRPYLTYVLNRRIQNADATKAAKLEARFRQLKLFEGTLVRRLEQQEELQMAAKHMQSGRNAEAARILRSVADGLEAPD